MESRNRVERCLGLLYASRWDPFFSKICAVGGGLMFVVGFSFGLFSFDSVQTDFGLLPNSVFMAMFSFQGAANLVRESHRTLITILRLLSVTALIGAIALWILELHSLFGFYVASILLAVFVTLILAGVFYRCRRTRGE